MNALSSKDFTIIPAPTTQWLVLTCSNAVTLRLADTLNTNGFGAWAPRARGQKRVGRMRNRSLELQPVMPGFVFALWEHVWDLTQMDYSPAHQFQVWDEAKGRMVPKACPPFTVLRHDGQPARIADRGLDALRMAEGAAKPAEEVKLFTPGDEVRYPAAGFEGLTGVVQSSKRKSSFVEFPGKRGAVEIPTPLLILVQGA